jgi:hypothetical protein
LQMREKKKFKLKYIIYCFQQKKFFNFHKLD